VPRNRVTGTSNVLAKIRSGGFVLRLALAALAVGWMGHTAGWGQVLATLANADPRWLLVALAALALESLGRLWNWGRLLDGLGCVTRDRLRHLVHAYLVGAMFGTILPSTASTDAMRGLLAQRAYGGRPTAHAAAIVIQNLLVWIAACTIGLICLGVLFATDRSPRYAPQAALLFAGVVGSGVALHVALKHYRYVWVALLRRVMRRRWYFLRRAVRRFADALLIFERAHVPFAPRALVACVVFLFSASVHASVAMAVGIDVPLVVWGAILPIASLSSFLPISISGLGGAQAVYVLLLAPFGVGVAQAFSSSALFALLNLMFNTVFGAIAWVSAPSLARPSAGGASEDLRLSESSELER
jgi:uncharacterized protein (TIRG00374 family)